MKCQITKKKILALINQDDDVLDVNGQDQTKFIWWRWQSWYTRLPKEDHIFSNTKSEVNQVNAKGILAKEILPEEILVRV